MSKILLGVVLLSSGCALATPPSAKFSVHVTDMETGMSIINAVIHSGFTQKADPWGLGVGESTRVKEPVNSNGMATFQGNTIRNERGGNVHANGYYSQRFGMKYKKNLVLNRWEPWDPTFEVRMRPKKNPVPMIHKGMLRKKVPIKQGKVGFDLEVVDWVEPYGRGKLSDFIFTLTPVTDPKQGIEYSLSFENLMDGIQEYIPPKGLRSEYIFPYEAPTNGYNASLNKYRLLYYPVISDYPANNLKDNTEINYIFRVRTEVDEEGNIVSAHYGRIKGEVILSDTPLIDLRYWFNPDPQSRSLESNTKPY